MTEWKIFVPEVNGGLWLTTFAVSREKAVSNVRYRLFGNSAHVTNGWKVYYRKGN